MKRIISFIIILLAVSGVSFAAERAVGEPNSSLENTRWTLIRVGDQKIAQAKDAKREAHIMLKPEGNRVAGSGGCNRIMGGYELKGKDISFTGMASTRMACVGSLMETESAFLKALEATRGWKIVGEKLTLVDGGGKALAEFRAVDKK